MRAEWEIRARIDKITSVKDIVSPSDISPIACFQYAAFLLRWVLGEDIPKLFYCCECRLTHEGEKCPQCGGQITEYMHFIHKEVKHE